MTHEKQMDFAGCLEEYETDVIDNNEFGYMHWVEENEETIKAALNIAKSMQDGYVSDQMDLEAYKTDKKLGVNCGYADIFKTMAQQLIKEETR